MEKLHVFENFKKFFKGTIRDLFFLLLHIDHHWGYLWCTFDRHPCCLTGKKIDQKLVKSGIDFGFLNFKIMFSFA